MRGCPVIMKLKVKHNRFKVPIYRSTLHVVVSNSVMGSIDWMEDKIPVKIHSSDNRNATKAYMFAYVTEKGGKHFFLFLKNTAKPGEIAHEVKHVVNQIFLWHGVKLSLANDESECYFVEVITDKVFNTIKAYNKEFKLQPKINIPKDLTYINPITTFVS